MTKRINYRDMSRTDIRDFTLTAIAKMEKETDRAWAVEFAHTLGRIHRRRYGRHCTFPGGWAELVPSGDLRRAYKAGRAGHAGPRSYYVFCWAIWAYPMGKQHGQLYGLGDDGRPVARGTASLTRSNQSPEKLAGFTMRDAVRRAKANLPTDLTT